MGEALEDLITNFAAIIGTIWFMGSTYYIYANHIDRTLGFIGNIIGLAIIVGAAIVIEDKMGYI
jgi:uncharacterized membrane protein YgdD (TMEM256/DUF423 family)